MCPHNCQSVSSARWTNRIVYIIGCSAVDLTPLSKTLLNVHSVTKCRKVACISLQRKFSRVCTHTWHRLWANWSVFSERELMFTFAICCRPSVCRLSSAVALCLSARLSVRLSQVGVLQKRLNVGSRKQCHTIAYDSSFLLPKIWWNRLDYPQWDAT